MHSPLRAQSHQDVPRVARRPQRAGWHCVMPAAGGGRTVHGARALVAVHRAQLAPAQRQVAVRVEALLVDGDVEGAVPAARRAQRPQPQPPGAPHTCPRASRLVRRPRQPWRWWCTATQCAGSHQLLWVPSGRSGTCGHSHHDRSHLWPRRRSKALAGRSAGGRAPGRGHGPGAHMGRSWYCSSSMSIWSNMFSR